MIIDDEVEMTRLLKMLLELEGFSVSSSPSGAGALEKIASETPDVFMIDYHLSDMSGDRVIGSIRAIEKYARTPIVVVSGRDVEAEVRRAGADDFMLKPFEPDALIATLKRMTGTA